MKRESRKPRSRRALAVLLSLAGAAASVSADAQPPRSPDTRTPRERAPVDLTGQWVAVVDEDWRGRGIGRLLLAEAERLTREKGLKRLVIGVMAGNAGAERLYAELGFTLYAKAMLKALA